MRLEFHESCTRFVNIFFYFFLQCCISVSLLFDANCSLSSIIGMSTCLFGNMLKLLGGLEEQIVQKNKVTIG